jgi:hypothetical protein
MTLELDTAAAAIERDHPFVPRGEWFEVCGFEYGVQWRKVGLHAKVCGLAEAAHASTTLHHDHEGTT